MWPALPQLHLRPCSETLYQGAIPADCKSHTTHSQNRSWLLASSGYNVQWQMLLELSRLQNELYISLENHMDNFFLSYAFDHFFKSLRFFPKYGYQTQIRGILSIESETCRRKFILGSVFEASYDGFYLRQNQKWSQIKPYLVPYSRGTHRILVDYQHFVEKIQYAYFNVWPPTKCAGRNKTYDKQPNTACEAIWSKEMINTAYGQKNGHYG